MKNKMRDIQKTSNQAKDFLPGIKLAHENWWHRTYRYNVTKPICFDIITEVETGKPELEAT